MSSFSIFKKRQGQINAANVHMTEAEAALAQSDFNIEKITEIENKFTGGAVLLVPGRIFIREGLLWKVCRKGPKKKQFFLFNDTLVYGSIVAGRYSNQQILPLSQMSVSAECQYQPSAQVQFDGGGLDEQLDVANAFQISHSNKSFHVFALSGPDKNNWLANLEKHITRVSDKKKTKVMTRPVWVPDSHCKECMVCGQKFTAFVRKHHCRSCGRVVCTTCSPHRLNLNPVEGGESKLERSCKDCFKKVLSSSMSQDTKNASSTPKDEEVPKRDPASPPPASVAAQLVSNVLQSRSPQPVRVQREGEGDSTDTEDSDDSGKEDEEAKQSKESSPSTIRHSPHRSKSESSRHAILRPKASGAAERPSSAHLEDSPSKIKKEETSEDHPTPPPRRKKLHKQKMKELQQQIASELVAANVCQSSVVKKDEDEAAKDVSVEAGDVENRGAETAVRENEGEEVRPHGSEVQMAGGADGEVTGKEGVQQPEKEDEVEPVTPPKDGDESGNPQKKPRRRQKYATPESQSAESAVSTTAPSEEPGQKVETETDEPSRTAEDIVSPSKPSDAGEQGGVEPETSEDTAGGGSEEKMSVGGVGGEEVSVADGEEGKVAGEDGEKPHAQVEESPPQEKKVAGTPTEGGTPRARPKGRRQKFKTPNS